MTMVIYGNNVDRNELKLGQPELEELDCPHDESPIQQRSCHPDDESCMSNTNYAYSIAPASTSLSKSSKFTFSSKGDEDQSISEMSRMSEQRFETLMMSGID
eukprot:CAMPEP_0172498810 /NCGR_PEP_ID=MMETSP1066-20121228/117773_1 /TAXON_ID=671091 /ORGANISM="Coscinodiscus wailesii, Strain CCMP2513" /LENGTH=101 /DNA_ID=CAMNT_0013272239 /DNA_START=12 /DNA_END=317 /DNA_ORIENTATION=-